MLKFSLGRDNTKLAKLEKRIGKKIYSLDLQSGVSCPNALDCKSRVIIVDGKRKIKDGPHCKFRCFAASQEVLFTNLYNKRRHNFLEIKQAKTVKRISALILESLPSNCEVVRLHVGGDFFSLNYFNAVRDVARKTPHIIWYGYTKSVKWLTMYEPIPIHNLRLTASYGGRYDSMIDDFNLHSSRVVYSNYQARKLKLRVDKDDYLAYKGNGSFALVVHGTQPMGSEAGKAWQRIIDNRKK